MSAGTSRVAVRLPLALAMRFHCWRKLRGLSITEAIAEALEQWCDILDGHRRIDDAVKRVAGGREDFFNGRP